MSASLVFSRRSLVGAFATLSGVIGHAGAAAGVRRRIEVGDAILDVQIDPAHFAVGEAALMEWVRQSARAVSAYYGKFPVRQARIRVSAASRGRVSNGKSYGYGGAHCTISVGLNSTLADLHEDWELTHELVHFGFPSVDNKHHWIEEGTATYVEPIARALVGNLTPEQVWSDMVRDMHQGLPQSDDRGLDNTHTWGRTYWGGALFCLLADIDIRLRSGNAKGLRDALRAIVAAGGTIEADWPLERALSIGDRATNTTSLMDLYRQMAPKRFDVDLPKLWEQLGIVRGNDAVSFNTAAPLAGIRKSIAG